MTLYELITKWRASALKERSVAQEHFIDICRRLGEPTPAKADPTRETYCFERAARKDTGGDGWADVWKRHDFAWEYKGKLADLDAAFGQLRLYAPAPENPPLLIVSDILRFRIPTNWTNSVTSRCWLSACLCREPVVDVHERASKPGRRLIISAEPADSRQRDDGCPTEQRTPA